VDALSVREEVCMTRRALAMVGCVAAMLLAGCSGDASDPGDCPNVAGVYEITAHSCQPTTVGTTLTIAQSGCDLTSFEPWPDWTGVVTRDGAMTWSGDAGGTTMTCNALLLGTAITSTCTPECEVTLEKQ
jgi:hypothetical protein